MIFSAAAYGADFKSRRGIPVSVSLDVPEAKIGGGDFYNVSAVPADGRRDAFQFTYSGGEAVFTFDRAGKFEINITVNHITKSSCASAHSEEYLSVPATFSISE